MTYFAMPTVMLFVCATHLVFGILLGAHAVRYRSREALVIWSVGNLTSASSWLLLAMRGAVPDWVSIALANALLVSGWALTVAGMFRFSGRPVRWTLTAAPGLIVFVLFAFVPPVADDLGARIIAVNLCLMCGFVVLITEVIRDQRSEPLEARYLVLAAVGVAVIANVVRAVEGAQLSARQDFLTSGPVQQIGLFIQGLALLTLSVGVLLMYQERLERQLHDAVLRDPLTELLNRRGLDEEVSRRAERRPRESRAVLLVDVDDFKSVNDGHGHAAGDRVLRHCASILTEHAGDDGPVGRYGGDEFAAVLHAADADEAVRRARRLGRAIASASTGRDGVRVTVSIGVAVAPDSVARSMPELVAEADQALYRAKRDGRNRVVLHGDEEARPSPQ
ncbi:MAG: GGDEF domain-containing protein [Gordonia sp. (in: high G+C Gram-positive bacteria)]